MQGHDIRFLNFRQWNEQMVKKYNPEEYLRSNRLITWFESKRFKAVKKALAVSESDLFLDVGCGAGHLLKIIDQGKKIGLDLSVTMLKLAQKKCSRRTFLVQADAQNLPFKDSTFDKISSTEVIEHIPKPQQMLAEIVRIAKEDATIVITIPNENLINLFKTLFFKVRLARFLFRNDYRPAYRMTDEWHLHTFNLKEFRRLINKLKDSLTIRQVQAIPFFFLPLRYVITCNKKSKKWH
ncbi:MAG: hypothetical protein DRG40_06485 [Deltaproteobacteria bacterium]|nr:MAG: hypothetical protein DRG40_06485 [Deltaproteobacteria bacterium]